MITRIIHVKGGEYALENDGRIRAVETNYGLSADTKPVEGVQNADRFFEMDTGTTFVFDETNGIWHEI